MPTMDKANLEQKLETFSKMSFKSAKKLIADHQDLSKILSSEHTDISAPLMRQHKKDIDEKLLGLQNSVHNRILILQQSYNQIHTIERLVGMPARTKELKKNLKAAIEDVSLLTTYIIGPSRLAAVNDFHEKKIQLEETTLNMQSDLVTSAVSFGLGALTALATFGGVYVPPGLTATAASLSDAFATAKDGNATRRAIQKANGEPYKIDKLQAAQITFSTGNLIALTTLYAIASPFAAFAMIPAAVVWQFTSTVNLYKSFGKSKDSRAEKVISRSGAGFFFTASTFNTIGTALGIAGLVAGSGAAFGIPVAVFAVATGVALGVSYYQNQKKAKKQTLEMNQAAEAVNKSFGENLDNKNHSTVRKSLTNFIDLNLSLKLPIKVPKFNSLLKKVNTVNIFKSASQHITENKINHHQGK